MNSKLQPHRNYPWILLDPWKPSKTPARHTVPDLHISIEHIPDFKFLLRVNVRYSEQEITLHRDKQFLIIERHVNRKEYGYECYTSCRVTRRIKLPERLQVNKIDTWVSADGFLHLLAPFCPPEYVDSDLVHINVPSVNNRTFCNALENALNVVQMKRYHLFFGAEPFSAVPYANMPEHVYKNTCPDVMEACRNVRHDHVNVQYNANVVLQEPNPANSAYQVNPVNPDNPTNPDNPANPDNSANPDKVTKSAQPVDSDNPDNTDQPDNPDHPADRTPALTPLPDEKKGADDVSSEEMFYMVDCNDENFSSDAESGSKGA